MVAAFNTSSIPLVQNLGGGYPDGVNLNNAKFNLTAVDVTAVGSSLATGAAITAPVSNVLAANGTKAVTLPAMVAGDVYLVYNSVATSGLKIFPASSSVAFNGGSGGAAITTEGKTLALLVATSSTNIAAIFTADS